MGLAGVAPAKSLRKDDLAGEAFLSAPYYVAGGRITAALLSFCGQSEIKKTSSFRNSFRQTGNYLLSRAASRQVSSAPESLTSVFGMGTGVSSPLSSPDLSLVFLSAC